jgi:hypothetical protein
MDGCRGIADRSRLRPGSIARAEALDVIQAEVLTMAEVRRALTAMPDSSTADAQGPWSPITVRSILGAGRDRGAS